MFHVLRRSSEDSIYLSIYKSLYLSIYEEPGLLADLERRVSAAESKFLEADLELRLEELEQAKQKQVLGGIAVFTGTVRVVLFDPSLKE